MGAVSGALGGNQQSGSSFIGDAWQSAGEAKKSFYSGLAEANQNMKRDIIEGITGGKADAELNALQRGAVNMVGEVSDMAQERIENAKAGNHSNMSNGTQKFQSAAQNVSAAPDAESMLNILMQKVNR